MKTGKRCADCGEQKAYAEYYVRSGVVNPSEDGHYLPYCKACHRARVTMKRRSVPTAVQVVRDELLANRIPSTVDAGGDADMLAWGCVSVVVLTAKETASGFVFHIPQGMRMRGMRAHVVVLVCEWTRRGKRGTRTFHYLDAAEACFYLDGRLKTGITYVVGRTAAAKARSHVDVLTESLMTDALDGIDILNEYRDTLLDAAAVRGSAALVPAVRGAHGDTQTAETPIHVGENAHTRHPASGILESVNTFADAVADWTG